DHETMVLVADHQRRTETGDPGKAGHRRLEHRFLAGQGEELLRIKLPRQGPEAGTGAAGEDDRDNHLSTPQNMEKIVLPRRSRRKSCPYSLNQNKASASVLLCALRTFST